MGPEWSIDCGSVASNDNLNDPPEDWSIGMMLEYHLGALVIHACEGADSDANDGR